MRRAALLAVVALAAWAPAAAALTVITPAVTGTAGDNGWYRQQRDRELDDSRPIGYDRRTSGVRPSTVHLD